MPLKAGFRRVCRITLARFAFALFLAGASGASPARGQLEGTWVPLNPPARQSFSFVCDAQRGQLVLFGGLERDGGLFNDVRAMSLTEPSEWEIIRPLGAPPSPREGQATAYDSRRGRMLVFGGTGDNADGVWSLDLSEPTTWEQLSPVGVPPGPRQFATAVYDSLRDRMLVFGGAIGYGVASNELWELTLGGTPTWTLLAPGGTPPSPRAGSALIVDSARDRLVLFGGGVPGYSTAQDTWTLPLAGAMTWSELITSGTPPDGYLGQGGAYDPVGDRLVAVSGLFYSTPVALSLGDPVPAWSPLVPVSGAQPPGRYENGLAYDPLHRAIVICGGYVNNTFRDTWSFSLAESKWTRLAPLGGELPPRSNHSAVLDSVTHRVIVYGGKTPFDLHDVWALELDGIPRWTQIAPSGTPPNVSYDVASACDTKRHRVLYFGGAGTYLATPGVVWSLNLEGDPAWSQLSTSGTPPSLRTGSCAIYDPIGDRFLVFGGLVQNPFTDVTNEVWSLSLSGAPTWTQLLPAGGPTGLGYASASYDPVRDRMIVFGGFDYGGIDVHNDVWALSLGSTPAWSLLAPIGTPPEGRFHSVAVVDASRDRLIVHGGQGHGGGFADAWEVTLGDAPEWRELHPAAPIPNPHRASAGVYDPVLDRMVVIGGQNNIYAVESDAWALSFAHQIKASAGLGGSIDPSGTVWVRDGVDRAFAISASAGYVVDDVEVDGASVGAVSSYTFANVTSDHKVRAAFRTATGVSLSVELDPDVLNLKSHAPWLTAYLEPTGVRALDIDISTLRIAGSVPAETKSATVGDHDGNGVSDLTVKFSRAALDLLLTPGWHELAVTGSTIHGDAFRGTDRVRVIQPGAISIARVTPNPMNPSGVLAFRTTAAGTVTVKLVDPQGRTVRTLMNQAAVSSGEHRLRIDGRGDEGEMLATGVYFYRIVTPDGSLTGRFMLLK